jgi:hypothetical protein
MSGPAFGPTSGRRVGAAWRGQVRPQLFPLIRFSPAVLRKSHAGRLLCGEKDFVEVLTICRPEHFLRGKNHFVAAREMLNPPGEDATGLTEG